MQIKRENFKEKNEKKKSFFSSKERNLIELLGNAVDLLIDELHYDYTNMAILKMVGLTDDDIARYGFSAYTER